MVKATIAFIDLAIIIILIYFVYKGYKNGFIPEFLRALGTLVSLVVAIRFMSDLSLFIFGLVDISPTITTIFSFVFIFGIVLVCFQFLSTKLLSAIKFSMTLGSLDRVAGIGFGLAKGAIIVSLCTVLLSFISLVGPLKEEIKASQLYNPMRQVLPLAYSAAKVVFANKYQPLYRELEESFSGQTNQRKGENAQRVIDYFRPK